MSHPAPTCRKPSAKRDAILDAAQRAFLNEGYAATSMDGVAAGAGVSKATIYAHFDSKEQLFAAVMMRRCDTTFCFTPPENMTDVRSTLTVIAQRLMALIMSPEALALYRVVVSESMRTPTLAQTFYETGPVRGRTAIAAAIDGLRERGALRADCDPMSVADQMIGMLRAECFHRTLLGLPPGRGLDETIADAVETLVRAYGA